MSLAITTSHNELGTCVMVAGEVDVSNAPTLREALDAALASVSEQPKHLSVDLAEVPYIDSTGIGVLVGTVHRAAEKDITVDVVRPQRNVARVLSMLGLDNELQVHGTQE